MTFEIALVLAILGISVVLFITEKLPMDIVALLVLGILAVTGLVTTEQALSGFGNPAVVTIWAMFILSDALTRTGIANMIGKQILKLTGGNEARCILVVMLTSGGLSTFMSNIGVAALMLPVVLDIARKTGTASSRLLMPLAYATLLGGLTTLIGTPPNLLVSGVLEDNGIRPFSLFDFSWTGVGVMLAGTFFVAYLGRYLLPANDTGQMETDQTSGLLKHYGVDEQILALRIPENSSLDGRNLREIRFGSVLGLSVLALLREGQVHSGLESDSILHSGDRLLVRGRLDRFHEIRRWRNLAIQARSADRSLLTPTGVLLQELCLEDGSRLIGTTLLNLDFRRRAGINVIALHRDGQVSLRQFVNTPLQIGDRLLVHGERASFDKLTRAAGVGEFTAVSQSELDHIYHLNKRIFTIEANDDGPLVGRTLADGHLDDIFDFNVLGLLHDGHLRCMPASDQILEVGDVLLVEGDQRSLENLCGLNELVIEHDEVVSIKRLESRRVGFIEAVLAPRSELVGETPRQLNFQDRFGLQILGIWRAGRSYRENLRNQAFHFGDAILMFGQRKHIARLDRDPDFLVITPGMAPVPNHEKAPVAALVMFVVLLPVLFNLVPIAISAVLGCVLMVLFGCLTMQEAYRAIEWKSIFLIAGMLPLGTAMDQTGAARMIAEGMMGLLGGYGPWVVIFGLYLVTALATTIIPTAALVLMMAPIVLNASTSLGIDPRTGMMAMAMAASASFTSPISHPSNLLVMGPGGYRFIDYIKLGAPLALVVFVVVMITLPIFWPI